LSVPKKDIALLLDIYECCKNIIELTKGMRYYKYEKEKKTRWAVERQFEIIGQATNKISKETQDLLNHIPWGQMVGLRNIIAHEYGEIITEKIWYATKRSIPKLISDLKKIKELKCYIDLSKKSK